MWHTLRISSETEPSFASAVADLLQATSRTLIVVTDVACLLWYVVTIMTPEQQGIVPYTFFVILAIGLVSALVFWLLPKGFLAAQSTWLIGLAATITLALYLFKQPNIAFFYALLPFVATATAGWLPGLFAEGLVIALVWWLSRSPVMPPLTMRHVQGIAFGGAFAGGLAWAITNELLRVVEWSLGSFERVRVRLEEAADQRVELKQVQQDLIQANKELARLSSRLAVMHQVAEEARRTKRQFVANVSHELRTPLNMIIGFSEMITQAPQVYSDDLPTSLLSDIAAIQRNSHHLSQLVNDVLDLSQIESERMVLSKEWSSLQEIIDEAVSSVRALFDSKGLYLETDVPADVLTVFCDSTRIRQVLINLLSNAGRFTERGGVQVRATCDDKSLTVTVVDTGPGIAQEDQDRIFEPFMQLDDTIRRRHGGSGLGLSISKQFVEMHGGEMFLESEVGVGTQISFSLPLSAPIPAALGNEGWSRWFSPYHQYEARTRRSKAPLPALAPRFVLVDKGGSLERKLRRYRPEAEIIAAQDVGEAVSELSRSPAQALVVNLPPFERRLNSAEQLNALPYGTPAIVCWVPGEDEAARQLGVARYLVKPITRQVLISTLESLGDGVESVLLVDDDPEILRLFARMLSSADRGYRVLRATNGQRALSLLRERHPDVMVLDLLMPGMSGVQVLEEKGDDPAIRIIPTVVVSSRDPTGEPLVSDSLTVIQGGGLSVPDLLACIESVSKTLSPSPRAGDQEPPETTAG